MLKNYLVIAFRMIWKGKAYAAINVLGLGVAFCISLFLFLTAYLQFTYDSSHTDVHRIFQLYSASNAPNQTSRQGSLSFPIAPAIKAEYPEVEAITRFQTMRRNLITFQGKALEREIYLTDPDFFQVFDFPLLEGNKSNVFADRNNVVLSQTLAQALFASEPPIGKQVLIGSVDDKKPYIVTGVLADAPYNSTIQYEALIRMENDPAYPRKKDSWYDNSTRVYLKLAPTATAASFEKSLRAFTKRNLSQTIENLKQRGARASQEKDVFALQVQSLSKLHFDRELSNGPPLAMVYTLLGIGFFILLISSINFINLNVARSLTRAREVGVRKSFGATKSQLFVQIWGESAVLCFIALLIGAFLGYTLLSEFNASFDARINLSHALQPGFILMVGGILLLVSLLAGGYPAWLMAKFNPVAVLRGRVTLKKPGVLRNSLLVVQFVMSILLTACTLIALKQVSYLRELPVGFQKEQVVSIPVGGQVNGRQMLYRLRNELAQDASIVSITGSGVNLGRGKDRVTSRTVLGFTHKGKEVLTDWVLVDYDYFKTLNIPVVNGRAFDHTYASDSLNRIVVTESMVKSLGMSQPIGAMLKDDTDTSGTGYQIIGVVPDFQLYSVADAKNPISMHISNSETIHYILVRLNTYQLASAMDNLKKHWEKLAPGTEFMGSFLDENISNWYKGEYLLSKLISLAAMVAIGLSCIGLFAVALMVVEQRTKEIGIRKVLGASVMNLIIILSKDFAKLIGIALLIAIPVSWFAMQMWLNHYPNRIQISVGLFVLISFGAFAITMLTVGFQAIKAALANPVKSLRSE